LYQLEGVVLGRRDQGEADRVVTMLTPVGRKDLLAIGVRKPRSRKAGHLELFSRTRVLVSRVKGSWDIVSQAESKVTRLSLQEDFQRGTYARYVAELALSFFEDEAEPALLQLVEQALAFLEEAEDPERVVRWYEQHLLTLAGFRPEWTTCVGVREGRVCHAALHPRPVDKRPYGLDPEHGGALCPDCLAAVGTEGRRHAPINTCSPSALSWLQALQRKPYAELAALSLPPATKAELRGLMERYIAHHLEYRPAVFKLMHADA
jgi:DNA repair protein RecO (recombination protein O)